MKQIPGTKAQGINGYNSHFFNCAWEVIGNDVANTVLDFFSSGKMLSELNITSLTLVPEVAVPNVVGD